MCGSETLLTFNAPDVFKRLPSSKMWWSTTLSCRLTHCCRALFSFESPPNKRKISRAWQSDLSWNNDRKETTELFAHWSYFTVISCTDIVILNFQTALRSLGSFRKAIRQVALERFLYQNWFARRNCAQRKAMRLTTSLVQKHFSF